MRRFLAGLKVYSLDWYWKYDLSYEQLAATLKDAGVNFIITQNSYLPMSDSAVKSEIPGDKKAKMDIYDDADAREALRNAGIEYYGAYNVFFNPALVERHGNYSYDAHGKREEKNDWYIGACPTCEEYVDEVIKTLKRAVAALDMDGVFLGFMRYAGFWETILPDTDMSAWKEFCFCPRCVELFEKRTGVKARPDPGETKGEWILRAARSEWTMFKCGVIAGIVERIKKELCAIRPNTKIVLNTLPFTAGDGNDLAKSLFGQDPSLLKDHVDIFEVMCYHQILAKPIEWIGKTGQYFESLTDKTTVCTVQSKALYTEGIHQGRGRAESISRREFAEAIQNVAQSGLDGVVVFTLSDFLEAKYCYNDDSLIAILQEEVQRGKNEL